MNAIEKIKGLLAEDRPLVVGIINLTPDSFSDGGSYFSPAAAVRRGEQLLEEGADIVELGAESTRPNSAPISASEELARLEETLDGLCRSAIVSVDTYKSETAEVALSKGAAIINDTSALRADPQMVHVVSKHNGYVVLMHAKDGPLPHATRSAREYSDVVREVSKFLLEQTALATDSGVASDRIIVDPGMGLFVSPNAKYSFELLARLQDFQHHGVRHPLMICTSRKGFLGGSLEDRDAVSQLTTIAAINNGAKLVRTHNVKMLRHCLEVNQQLRHFKKP